MKDREYTTQEPRIVKNRDIPLLNRILYVMQDICSLEKRCDWQHDRMINVTQKLSDMPRSGSGPVGFDAIYSAIDELNEEHREKIRAYISELKAAERIINNIPSRTMRTFVMMMYVDCVSGEKVRSELNMTEWGFRRARDCVENAPDMASVKWRERYILAENTQN